MTRKSVQKEQPNPRFNLTLRTSRKCRSSECWMDCPSGRLWKKWRKIFPVNKSIYLM